MSPQPRVDATKRFLETCLRLELLDETAAESLSDDIENEDGFVAQAAVQRGLLSAADIDIVQALQHPNDIVPGYKILDLIGRGGMGVVYRAMQLDLEKIVALKTILIGNVNDPTVAARFEREAKSLAQLHHPSIVQAFNFGKHEGRYYFAMEYVPGRTCEQAVNERGMLPAGEVWSIARQVASGLMHASRQNLIHRDIKPANLILLPPPEGSASGTEMVKIADFGLAMFMERGSDDLKLTTENKIMGSPAYMSPEQFGGRGVDFRTDMYSLGATVWHLLFGKAPFQGTSVAALYQEKSERLVIDPNELPVSLPTNQLSLLLGLLDPDPGQRPSSYEQLIDAIDALGVCDATGPMGASQEPRLPSSPPISISDQPTQVKSLPTDLPQQTDAPRATMDPPLPTETLRLSEERIRPRRSRWWLASSVLAALVVAVAIISFRQPSRGSRTYTRVAATTPLFDGVTLSGWDVGGSMVGAWNTVEAPDASTAIACMAKRGALTRRFPASGNVRVSLFVWLQDNSGPVDIDFAFDPADSSDLRGSLRMSGTATQLGTKTADFTELDVVAGKRTAGNDSRSLSRRAHRTPVARLVRLSGRETGRDPTSSAGRRWQRHSTGHPWKRKKNRRPRTCRKPRVLRQPILRTCNGLSCAAPRNDAALRMTHPCRWKMAKDLDTAGNDRAETVAFSTLHRSRRSPTHCPRR